MNIERKKTLYTNKIKQVSITEIDTGLDYFVIIIIIDTW